MSLKRYGKTWSEAYLETLPMLSSGGHRLFTSFYLLFFLQGIRIW